MCRLRVLGRSELPAASAVGNSERWIIRHYTGGTFFSTCRGVTNMSFSGKEMTVESVPDDSPLLEEVFEETPLADGTFLRLYSAPWKLMVIRSDSGLLPTELFCDRRIALFGAGCSGKSTFARFLCNNMVSSGIHADVPYEAASAWIQRYGVPDFLAQTAIFAEQRDSEDRISASGKVVISDSPFPLASLYVRMYAPAQQRLHGAYFKILEDGARGLGKYSDVFYMSPLPWVNDGVRRGDSVERDRLDSFVLNFLTEFCPNFIRLDIRNGYENCAAIVTDRFFSRRSSH